MMSRIQLNRAQRIATVAALRAIFFVVGLWVTTSGWGMSRIVWSMTGSE
jgi:hypothetical protein